MPAHVPLCLRISRVAHRSLVLCSLFTGVVSWGSVQCLSRPAPPFPVLSGGG